MADTTRDPEQLYVKQEKIGKGSFGEVYKGYEKASLHPVAIKIIDLEAAEDDIEDIQQEITVLSQLDSPFVTKYYGSFLKESKLWIVMELLSGGSCMDLLKAKPFEELFIAIIMREVLKALDYLHTENKIHRDIKAANILLAGDGSVKLADFGVSGQITATMTKKNTFVGTPFWMAPEVIKQTGYSFRADIWSLGITAIELAHGEPPNSDLHPMRVLFIIPKNDPPQLEGNYSRAFKDFCHLCLQKDPEQRPTAKDLLKHRFIRSAKKVAFLTELIERHEQWKIENDEEDATEDYSMDTTASSTTTWDFGTVKANGQATNGSIDSQPSPTGFIPNGPRDVGSVGGDPNATIRGFLPPPPDFSPPSSIRGDVPDIDGNENSQAILHQVITPTLQELVSRYPRQKAYLVELQEGFRKAEDKLPGVTEALLQGILEKVSIESE